MGRELSAQEFEQSMTQAVSSMGNLEEAQLQQYTKMIRDKFSEFDSDQSGGIRSEMSWIHVLVYSFSSARDYTVSSIVEWQTLSQAGQKAAEAAQQKKVAQENVQLQAVYNKADHDADGKLTQQEMLDGFSQYGYDSSQVRCPLMLLCFCCSTLARACACSWQQSGYATHFKRDRDQIDKFFKVGDADKDSLLTFQEFLAGREGMQSESAVIGTAR